MEKNNAGSITYYWYDDAFNVISTTGAVTRDYVYFNGRKVAFLGIASGNQHYLWGGNLGSVDVMSNSDGSSIEWEADYFPYGAKRQVFKNNVDNYFLFTGYEFDYELNDNYADFREQSPSLGRFFSPDRFGGDAANPQSLNLYSYVLDEPTNFVDRLGLHWECISSGIAGQGGGSMTCTWVDEPGVDGPAGTSGSVGMRGPHYVRPRPVPPFKFSGKCLSSRALSKAERAELNAASFYAEISGKTVGFGIGASGAASLVPEIKLAVGGGISSMLTADASGQRALVTTITANAPSFGAGIQGGLQVSIGHNQITPGWSGSLSGSASAGAGLGAGIDIDNSGTLTLNFGTGLGAKFSLTMSNANFSYALPICRE